jgi:hypothetical protein
MELHDIYFSKNDILQLKSELHQLFNAIILIHSNTITIVWDYTINEKTKNDDIDTIILNRFIHDMSKQNNCPLDTINQNINNDIKENEQYEDKYYFSFFDSVQNNLYNDMNAAEEMSLSFSINDNIINCICNKIEIDPNSIMYDQSAYGSFKFQIQNDKFVYISGQCEDRYGDCYGIYPDLKTIKNNIKD